MAVSESHMKECAWPGSVRLSRCGVPVVKNLAFTASGFGDFVSSSSLRSL